MLCGNSAILICWPHYPILLCHKWEFCFYSARSPLQAPTSPLFYSHQRRRLFHYLQSQILTITNTLVCKKTAFLLKYLWITVCTLSCSKSALSCVVLAAVFRKEKCPLHTHWADFSIKEKQTFPRWESHRSDFGRWEKSFPWRSKRCSLMWAARAQNKGKLSFNCSLQHDWWILSTTQNNWLV